MVHAKKGKLMEEMVIEAVKCEYCWKVIEGEPVKATIWVNGWQRDKVFCCKEHAAYAQMSAEG